MPENLFCTFFCALPSKILNKIFAALQKEKLLKLQFPPLILEFQGSSCVSWWRFWKDSWLWGLHHSIVCDLCYTRLLENMNTMVLPSAASPNLQPHHPWCVLSQLKHCWVKSWEQLVLFPSSLLPFLPPASFSHLFLISWYILAFPLPSKIRALPLGNTPGYKSQVFPPAVPQCFTNGTH